MDGSTLGNRQVRKSTAMICALLFMALAPSCASESEELDVSTSVAATEVPPPPEYFPDDNWERPPPEGRIRSLADVEVDNAALREAALEHRRPARWVAGMRERISDDTVVLIVTFKGDAGPLGDGYAFDVEVEEQLAGPLVSASLTIRQVAAEGAPLSCGGLRAGFGGRALVVLNPSSDAGVYDLILDFQSGVYGWARETGPGTFRVYGGTLVDTSDVASVTEDSP